MNGSDHVNDEGKQSSLTLPELPVDEVHEARVDKFIEEKIIEMKAGNMPVFPMGKLLELDLRWLKTIKKNKNR